MPHPFLPIFPYINQSTSPSSPSFFPKDSSFSLIPNFDQMVKSSLVAAVAVAAGFLTFLLTSLYLRRQRQRLLLTETKDFVRTLHSSENPHPGSPMVKLHRLHHQAESESKRRLSNLVFSYGVKPLFSWEDHPSLVNDAVENGWTQFAFTGYISSSPSARSRLLNICSAGEIEREIAAEISWEVSQESMDFMQKIKLNSGLMNVTANNVISSVIRTALPLPGPPLASFPQEAYFEITILKIGDERDLGGTMVKEGERAKLIGENVNSKTNSDSSVGYFPCNNKVSNVEDELKRDGRRDDEDGKDGDVMLCVGLTSEGSSNPAKFPGSYPGSIGFNSNGSLYLDGMKLVFESEKEEWGRTEKVIGCGFDPKQKKVYFTVDSAVVHVVCCKSEEFGKPMYPTLAANAEVTVMVNLGQSEFKYMAAQRTPNPCFVGPLLNAAAAAAGNGFEDSRELFSMGMIDGQWSNRPNNRACNTLVVDDDESSDEIELFEIVVEDTRHQTVP